MGRPFSSAAVMLLIYAAVSSGGAQTASTISGTTVAAGGGPVASVVVDLYGGDGSFASSTTSDSAGAFSFGSLTAGAYYLIARSKSPYVQEIYDGVQCTAQSSLSAIPCNPRTGTQIGLTAGQTRTVTLTLDVGGTISGRVVAAATGQASSESVPPTVALYDASGTPVLGEGVSQVVAPDGTFSFSGLAAGTYFVRAMANRFTTSLVDEVYDNLPCIATVSFPLSTCDPTRGTPIQVALGATVSGIDIALDTGATITGTISFEGAPDAATTTVSAYRGTVRVAQTQVNGGGPYSLKGLATGAYTVRAEQSGSAYVDTWYGGAPVISTAAPATVSVTAGATTSGIDILLRRGGSIQGTLSYPAPPSNNLFRTRPFVSVYTAQGMRVKTGHFVGVGDTGGPYSIDGLPAGTYYVAAEDPVHQQSGKLDASSGYTIPELYDDIPCVNIRCTATSGTPVVVAAGQATKGIDVTLENGASISGSVTFGGTIDSLALQLYDSNGVRVDRVEAFTSRFLPVPNPSTVSFVARGLPPGVYYLRTVTRSYIDEAWNDLPCEGCAPLTGTPITLAQGEDRGNITFDLVRAPVTVSGTVTDASTGTPLPNVSIDLYSHTGQLVASTTSDNLGGYSIPAVQGTTYFARASNRRGYADETYSDIACTACPVTSGTPISVAASSKTGVDFTLTAASRVEGTVVDSATSAALAGVPVALFDASGARVARVATNAFGAWQASVPPATYYAVTDAYPGYTRRIYSNIPCEPARLIPAGGCNPLSGTPITAAADVAGVNFSLPACGALSISPAFAPLASLASPYRFGLAAVSAAAPAVFTIVDGALPPGLTMTGSVISGTPQTAGTWTFTAAIADQSGCSTTRTYSIAVSNCSTSVSVATVAFIPTAPGPGVLRIDAGPNHFVMPAAGGTVDFSVLGTCSTLGVFANSSVSDPWLHVIGPDYTNNVPQPAGRFTVDPNPSAASGRSGFVTINGWTIAVRQAAQESAAPFGIVDTPVDGTTVRGPIPISGWVLDDAGVTRVRIYRDAVAPEPPGLVYIADATFVRGARPDVERIYRASPGSDRAGWGYLLLSNVLPNQGNGTYRLWVYADDAEGHTVLLGTRAIVGDNAHLTIPFGTIDTPAEGATISGSSYVNFGWALTAQPKTIPKNGATVQVYVDGALIGTADYDHFRQDVFDTFPGLANSDGAVGFRIIDTTQLVDGMHTIGWFVVDDAGAAAGMGSRYFVVQNNGVTAPIEAVPAASAAAARVDEGRRAASLIALPSDRPRTIGVRALEPIDLDLDARDGGCRATYAGYDGTSGELRALPIGSTLDAESGRFTWQPGPGFVGIYRLVFVRDRCDGTRERIPVTVTIK